MRSPNPYAGRVRKRCLPRLCALSLAPLLMLTPCASGAGQALPGPSEAAIIKRASGMTPEALRAAMPSGEMLLFVEPFTPASIREGYMDHRALRSKVRSIAGSSPLCRLSTIGESREMREIFLLTLSSDHASAHRRPALLITAGLDGRHWVGTETAVRVAERILADHADLLDEMTIYVIPRANPDGAQLNFGALNTGHIGTLRPVDLDRDGQIGEDGFDDLNDDAVITQMRRANPPLRDNPTHLPDPNEPRLMKTPDRSKGEVPTHTLHPEGLDSDGDGAIAEDGIGFVDLDRNFMHLWPEHAPDAGPYQLSEPESLALAEFVLKHTNITLAVTYGRHDNMINVPDHRGRDINRRVVTGIDEGDKPMYDQLSKLFKDTTGQKRATREDLAGSFHAWLYAQRGIPSVATIVWGRPDIEEPRAEDGAEARDQATPARAPGDPVTGEWSGTINLPEMEGMEGVPSSVDVTMTLRVEDLTAVSGSIDSMMGSVDLRGEKAPGAPTATLQGDMGGGAGSLTVVLSVTGDGLTAQITGPLPAALTLKAKRVSQPAAETPAQPAQRQPRQQRNANAPADPEEAAWLRYSDSRGGVGFVDWTPFDHPQLGPVEIGGWVPGFKMNPPADELDGLAEKQTAFAVALIDMRPRLRLLGPEIDHLGPGVVEVRLAIANNGAMPSRTAMGQRARAMLPTVLRLSTPVDQILTGSRLERAWGIDAYDRADFRWILLVEPGETIEIELLDEQLGDLLITFTAEEGAEPTITTLPENRR